MARFVKSKIWVNKYQLKCWFPDPPVPIPLKDDFDDSKQQHTCHGAQTEASEELAHSKISVQ